MSACFVFNGLLVGPPVPFLALVWQQSQAAACPQLPLPAPPGSGHYLAVPSMVPFSANRRLCV